MEGYELSDTFRANAVIYICTHRPPAEFRWQRLSVATHKAHRRFAQTALTERQRRPCSPAS